MTEEVKSFDTRLAAIQASYAEEVITRDTYSPERLLGRFGTISALAEDAFTSGEIDLAKRSEVILGTANASREIAENMGDLATASAMRTTAQQVQTVLELTAQAVSSSEPQKAKPSRPTARTTSQAKR